LPLPEICSSHEKRETLGYASTPKALICPECGESLDIFTLVHIAKHGYTRDEFLDKYPEYDSHGYWGTAWHLSKCCVPGCKSGVASVRYWTCRTHALKQLKKGEKI